MNTKWIAFAGLLLLLLVVFLLAPIHQSSRAVAATMDACHAPAFAALAGMCYQVRGKGRQRGRWGSWVWGVGIWLAVMGMGLATEWVQDRVGRSGNWHDAWANGSGALAGVFAARAGDAAVRWRGALLGAAGLILLLAAVPPGRTLLDCYRQQRAIPELASFEREVELSRWLVLDCELRRTREHATSGSWSAQIDLRPGPYSGIATLWPFRDWSPYEELAFDVWIDSGAPLDLLVKVEDQQHNGEHMDRFNRILRLDEGAHSITIPLHEIRTAPRDRELDLRHVRFLQFVVVRPGSKREMHLDHVELR